jgi:hypothetical protein
MHAAELDAQRAETSRQASTNLPPLSELERDLLKVLTDKPVCTSVLHARARLLKGFTPTTTRDRDRVIAACDELVRRGLASRRDAPRTIWWHRSKAGQSSLLT